MRFEIVSTIDVYAGAPQASSAAQFGTLGITFRAVRPAGGEEWEREVAALSCGLPS